MTTRTRVKKIDADTHFLPPVDMEELRQFLPKHYNKEAVNMLLRDAGVFADPNARRGGFGLPQPASASPGRQWRPLQRRDRLAVLLAMGSHKTGLVSCLRPASICKC